MLVRQRLGDRGTCCPLFVTSQAGFLSELAAVAVQGGRRDKGADKKEISNRTCCPVHVALPFFSRFGWDAAWRPDSSQVRLLVLVGFSRSHSLSHFGSVETQSVPLFFFVLLLLAKLSHLGSAGRVSSMSYGQDGAHRTRGPVTYFFLICPLVFRRFLLHLFGLPSQNLSWRTQVLSVRQHLANTTEQTRKERQTWADGATGPVTSFCRSQAQWKADLCDS